MKSELDCFLKLSFRSWRSAVPAVRSAISTCLLLFAASAIGQVANRDYYHLGANADDGQALRNVEQYHLGPGAERMNTRNYAGAYEDFVFILQYFPNHPKVLALMSELCDLKWKVAQCEVDEWFARGVQRNPNAAPTYIVLGLHQQRLNRLPEAVESYKKAISLNPESGNAHYNLGLAYFAQKKYDLATREAQLSKQLGIELPGLHDMLARAGQWKPVDPEELKQDLQRKPAPTSEVKTN